MGDGDHGHIHPRSFCEMEAVLGVHGHITPPSSGKGRGADYAHRPHGFFGNNEWVVEAMAIYNLPILGGGRGGGDPGHISRFSLGQGKGC